MNQIALSLSNTPSFAAEDYVLSDANRLAYEQLMAWPNWPDYALWLYGPAHAGKSHLAAIWQHTAQAMPVDAEALASIETTLETPASAYLLDDISRLSDEQQAGLFHLLNHTKNNGKHLLLISRYSPNQLALSLPDLQSRLKSLPTLALDAPDDALLQAVWFKLFADRQLQVPAAVVDYLMQRSERSFEAISQTVERIDSTALAQKRDITIPFVRSLLLEKAESITMEK